MSQAQRDDTITGYPPLTPEAVRALLQTMTPQQVADAFIGTNLAEAAQVTGHDCQWWSAAGVADIICFFRLDADPWPLLGRRIGYFLACVPHRRDEPGAAEFQAGVLADLLADQTAERVEVLFQGEYRD